VSSSSARTGIFVALTGALLFAIAGVIAAGVFDTVSPARTAQSRAVIAAVVLLGYGAFRRRLALGRHLWRFAVIGVIIAALTVAYYESIARLGVGPGITIEFLAPVLVLAWIATVRGERVRPAVWVAAVAAVTGVGFVTRAWQADGGDLVGIGFGLAAAALYAAYILLGERLSAEHHPLAIGAWGFTFAAVFWLVVLPPWTFPWDEAGGVGLELVAIGVLGTAIPFVLSFVALSLASPGVIGVVLTAEPPFAAILAAMFLDQHLVPIQWIGVVLVAIAVSAMQRFGDAPLASDQPAVT